MREGDCRIRVNNAVENMPTVRRVSLNLLKREKSVEAGIKANQKPAGYDNDYPARVLSVLRRLVPNISSRYRRVVL